MQNFLDPAILIFVFGILAGLLRSNLEIPQPISRFLSLYLLMALGLKRGFALGESGLSHKIAVSWRARWASRSQYRWPAIRGRSPWLLGYALGAPVVHAGVALALAWTAGMSAGNGALLMALAASASYIAVPAVTRHAIPEASPSLYFGMSLGLTFPFNILLGVPLRRHQWPKCSRR